MNLTNLLHYVFIFNVDLNYTISVGFSEKQSTELTESYLYFEIVFQSEHLSNFFQT